MGGEWRRRKERRGKGRGGVERSREENSKCFEISITYYLVLLFYRSKSITQRSRLLRF